MMKFTTNYQVKGERVREFFALFPVKLNNEIKWMEVVSVREEFRYAFLDGSGWYKVAFEDENPKLGDTRIKYKFLWTPLTIDSWTRFFRFTSISQLFDGNKWINQHWAHYL
jgi:hypothetical protein